MKDYYPKEQEYDIQPRKSLSGKEWNKRKKANKLKKQARRRNRS